jgi:hypothetical protein
MSEQFENPEAAKLEDQIPSPEAEKKIEHIADKAAGKAAKTEQHYDADHTIFTK